MLLRCERATRRLAASGPTNLRSRKNLLASVISLGTLATSFVLNLSPAIAAPVEKPDASKSSTLMTSTDVDFTNADGPLPDIVVTARRISEPLQTTPVAISVLTEVDLEKSEIRNIADLQSRVPTLTFSNAVTGSGSANLFIRGQGSLPQIGSVDPAVGVYINGVYSARNAAGAFDLVDLQRVEVLRGPQGTTFGRNTTGGAISLVPNEPSSELAGELAAQYASYDSYLVRGLLNVPLLDDRIALRVVAQRRERGDVGYNPILDQGTGSFQRDFVRASVRVLPLNHLSVLIQADYFREHNDGQITGLKSFASTPANQLLLNACSGLLGSALAALCPYGRPNDSLARYQYVPGSSNLYRVYGEAPSSGRVETRGISATIDYNINDQTTLRSITAWRGVRAQSYSDLDGTPYAIIDSFKALAGTSENQDQFSQELLLRGRLLNDKVSYVSGLFYLTEDVADDSSLSNLFPLVRTLPVGDSDARNRSYAAYGQAQIEVATDVRFTLGARKTWDSRRIEIRNYDLNTTTGVKTPSYTPTDGDPNDALRSSFSRDFEYWSYTAGLDWRPSKDVLLYARTSRAQRSGGFNARPTPGGIPPVSYRPERVTEYAAGTKLDLLDQRIRFNSEAFYTRLADAQRDLVGISGGIVRSGANNAASGRTWGLEADATASVARGITLGGSFGLFRSEYKRFISTIDDADLSSLPFIYTPRTAYSVFGDYEMLMRGSNILTLHVDYSYRTKVYALPPYDKNLSAAANKALIETARISGYGLLNAKVTVKLIDYNLELSLFGRNITKKDYFVRLLPLQGNALGITSYGPGEPRTIGVSALLRL